MERQIEKYFQEELNADERLDFLKQVESDNELKKQFIKFKNTYALLSFSDVNPAKRKAMVAKNEKRFLKQKRNVLQKSESLSFRSDYPVKIQASFKRLLKAV